MATVKLIADDPRDVQRLDGTWAQVEAGGTLETDDEHAKALVHQKDVWEAVADKPASKSKDKE